MDNSDFLNNDTEETITFESMEDDELTRDWPLRIKVTHSGLSPAQRQSYGSSLLDSVTVVVQPIDTVAHVKHTILQAIVNEDENDDQPSKLSLKQLYIRLICKGRLLAPDVQPLKDFNFVKPNDCVHAIVVHPSAQSQQTQSSRSTRYPTSSRHANSNIPARISARGGVQAAIQQGNLHAVSQRALRSAGIDARGNAVRPANNNNNDDDDSSSSSHEGDIEQSSPTRHQSRRRQLRGFDRLRHAGLRRGEIAALRTYFSGHVDRFIAQQEQQSTENNIQQTNDALLQRQLHEEAWMFSQGPTSELRLNLPANVWQLFGNNRQSNNDGNGNSIAIPTGEALDNNPWVAELRRTAANSNNATNNSNNTNSRTVGNDRDFLCGFLLGFFVGFFMLVWVWMPTVPHKQKLGILTGITVQLALNLLSPPPPSEEDEALRHDQSIPNAYRDILLQSHGEGIVGGSESLAPNGLMDDAVVLG